MNESLIEAIVNLDENHALIMAEKLLEEEHNPWEILDACRKAMNIIGKRFEMGESFIPELVFAGEILEQITFKVKPHLNHEINPKTKGTVVIGTVQGDIHDIAKDIVVFMLEINGFDVIDLGVDVPPQAFVEKVIDEDVRVLGLSGFLTLAFEPMKTTIEALSSSGLRDKVKVMIGGGPVDEQVRQYTGADAWGKDAMSAVKLAEKWTNNLV